MRTKIFILIFLICTTVNAEIDVYSPIGFRMQRMANTVDISDELMPFIPDTISQILFNPARASTYSSNFIYINYYPQTNSSRRSQIQLENLFGQSDPPIPTLSIFSLIKRQNSAWLFQFENGINNREMHDQSDEDYTRDSNYSSDIITFEEETNITNQISSTQIKITRSQDCQFGGLAIGLWGIYDKVSENVYSMIRRYNSILPFESSLNRRIDTLEQMRDLDGDNSKYAIGLDVSLAGNDWDFQQTVGYTISYNNNELFESYINTTIDSLYFGASETSEDSLHIRGRNYERSNDEYFKQKPDILYAKMYFRKKLAFLCDSDHIYISILGAHSFNDVSTYRYAVHSLDYQYYGEKDDPSSFNADTSDTYGIGEANADFWMLNAKCGYIVAKNLNKISLLLGLQTGISITSILNSTSSLNNTNWYFRYMPAISLMDAEGSITQYSLEVPIRVQYKLKEGWFVFGGLKISYNYINEKMELVTTPSLDQISGEPEIMHGDLDYKNEELHTSKRFYLGASLYLPHNIVAHIAFNNRLADYNYWNVSLGYHF